MVYVMTSPDLGMLWFVAINPPVALSIYLSFWQARRRGRKGWQVCRSDGGPVGG